MVDAYELNARLNALRQLHDVVVDLNSVRDLGATLQAVTDAVVASLEFDTAAVNVVRPDRDLEVAAVSGDEAVRATLLGRVGPRQDWDRLLATSAGWGTLRFVPESGTSPLPPEEEPQPWRPMDALLAPLRATDGELVGVLSVDRPSDQLRPGAWKRELLEMFAAQAAVAIDSARCHTETRQALARLEREQAALRASEESFRLAFENAPSGMAMVSLREVDRGRLMRANEALCHTLGYPEPMLRRVGLETVTRPEDRHLTAACLAGESGTAQSQLRLMRADGTDLWAVLRSSAVPDAVGSPDFLLVHVEDVSDRLRDEQHLLHRATHDPLTGLPNRDELRLRLDAMLGDRVPLAVLFCDLDGFKQVNDAYGHHVGDAVLTEVAARLRSGVRDGDTVARVGGDEFVVLAANLGETEATDLAGRLATLIASPLEFEGHRVTPSASIGVSWTSGATAAGELLREADRRMYQRKRVSR